MALTGIELAGSVLVGTTSPVDIKFGPFNGTTYADAIILANTEVNSGLRYKGLTVGLTENNGEVKEYWYKNGVTDADLVEKTSGGPSSPVDMQDVYNNSAATIVEAADYTKSLNLVNSQFFFVSNDQTNNPIASTAPRVTFDMSTTTTSKQLFAASTTVKDDDSAANKGRAVYGSFNNEIIDPVYTGCSGFLQCETYGDQTAPLSPYIIDITTPGVPTVENFTSGSGVLIKGIANRPANMATARLQTEQSSPIPSVTPTTFNVGYVEVVTIPINNVGEGSGNSVFSIGTDKLNLLNSVKASNSNLAVKPGDILSIEWGKLEDDSSSLYQINQVEAQSITPQKFVTIVDRKKSPTCYVDTAENSITLNIDNVKNGQYGTIYVKHKAGFSITLGTVNDTNPTHEVVNGGNGVLPVTATAGSDVYTYLWLEEDDSDPPNTINKMVWTYGLNYT